jgi:DNA-binding GntR family transcriptional regulator
MERSAIHAETRPRQLDRIRTITESVAELLREEIRTGALEPGSRLRQVEVAQRFNVSTTPVREAFAALEREGLLVSSSHRGVVVFRPSSNDLEEIYEIRIPLEALATEKAVPNISEQDLKVLADLIQQMSATVDDPLSYGPLNQDFHARIYAAARRPKLEKLIFDLRDASTAYLRLYATFSITAAATQVEHEEIFDAIRSRAPKRAAKAMAAHLQHTVDYVSEGLRTGEAEPNG